MQQLTLIGLQQLLHPQEAEGDPHDAGLVQVGADSARERQSAGELVKHLRLLTAATSGRVTGAQLSLFRTGPAGGRRESG